VILNWNGLADTGESVQSVNRQEYPDLEVLVIDNGSAPEPDQTETKALNRTGISSDRRLGCFVRALGPSDQRGVSSRRSQALLSRGA
jgi:glycosyltransferase involved in cell wall biosynthesis